jgi:hypothetical protein
MYAFRTYRFSAHINRLFRRAPDTRGSDAMKAAAEPVAEPAYHSRDLSGPAAAIAMALIGAALVAAGLLLIGLRDVSTIGHWAPPAPLAITASD